MRWKIMASSRRIAHLYAQGYCSNRHNRPKEGEWVSYDLFFMGQRMAGSKQLTRLYLDIDGALNPIDAALLSGAGPGIDSVYWRPTAVKREVEMP